MLQLFFPSSNRQIGPDERLDHVGEFPHVFGSSVVVTCQSLHVICEEVGKAEFVDEEGKMEQLEEKEIEVQNQVEY